MRTSPGPRMEPIVSRMDRLVAVIDRVIEGHAMRRGVNGGHELSARVYHFARLLNVLGHLVTLAGTVGR